MTWLDPMEPSDDAVAQLLTTWRSELDDHAANAMSTELPVIPSRSRRWVRAHQRTAVATAIVVAIAGSTSVAAAVTGPSGPLGGVHSFFWGHSPATAQRNSLAKQVDHVLDQAAAGIHAAEDAGSITDSARVRLNADLDQAQTLLNGDPTAPAALQTRVDGLRAELAAVPAPAPPPATSQHHGHGGDTPGDDQTGRSGEGRQGSDSGQGSDDSQGDDNSGRSGSDDGSRSGSQDGNDGGSDDSSSGDQQDKSGSQDGDDTTSGGDGQSDDGGGDNSGSDGISSSDQG